MSEKRRAEKNFPLLRPLPEDGDYAKLKRIDPLFWGELERLKNFTAMVFCEKRRKKRIRVVVREFREVYGLRKTDREIYAAILQALKAAQEFIRFLIAKIPNSFRGVLESEGAIAEERDFIALLEKWEKFLDQNDLMLRMREYEARRLYSLTIIFFELNLYAEILNLNGASLQKVTRYLEQRFFNLKGSSHKTVVAFHDSKDDFRVAKWYFKENAPENLDGFVKKEYEFVCRCFTWLHEPYFVYYSPREKTTFSHCLKMLRKDERDPEASVLDKRGFKMVFFDQGSMEAALNKLRYCVFVLAGVTWKLEDGTYFHETPNIYSSKHFKAKKFVRCLQGKPVEIIIETIVNHLNGIESRGEESHALYRLRQLIRSGLPLVFPQEIYGIDWKEKEAEIVDLYFN